MRAEIETRDLVLADFLPHNVYEMGHYAPRRGIRRLILASS